MDSAPGLEKSDEIAALNQSAFNALMKGFNKASHDWVLDYVARIGISMRSRQWLPAAIAGRLTLDMHVAGRDAAQKNAATTQQLLDSIAQVQQARDAINAASLRDSQRRREDAEQLLLDLKASARTSSTDFGKKLDSAVDTIKTAAQGLHEGTVSTTTQALISSAERRLDTSITRFIRFHALALSVAFGIGLALGIFATHSFDTSHPKPVEAQHHGK